MRGRPLAFLALVVTGWGAGRVASLLPDAVMQPIERASRDMLVPPAAAAEVAPDPAPTIPLSAARADFVSSPVTTSRSAPIAGRAVPAERLAAVVVAAASLSAKSTAAAPSGTASPAIAPAGLPPVMPIAERRSRWSGSAWAIARDGGGGSLLSPLLGGSQAGVRVAYRLDERGRVAMFARATTPLKDGAAELAAGAQWRPTRAPVTVYAEVRAIRGYAAPAVGVFGGGAVALPANFRLEGYGQAGVIDRDGVSGFGDGQVRVVRPIDRVEVGAGAWAAAQRGASRLDIGPSLAVPIPADPLALRITLDWRHRIAGNARPASGPVISLGADF